MINAKKWRKPVEWERLEISSIKLYTKGTFLAMMGLIRDRNSLDLRQAEDIKKRWQQYTEELYKKDLNDPDNHDGVFTHLEPYILECEVKWALETSVQTKLVETMEFHLSYFIS